MSIQRASNRPGPDDKFRSQHEYRGDDPLEARPANLGVDQDSVRIDVQMNEFRLIVQER